jgi:hypothetical protein
MPPNITGGFGGIDQLSNFFPYGAFELGQTVKGGQGDGTDYTCTFDASRSNPIYGKSNTVQPPAIRVSWCIQVYNATTGLSEQQAAQLASEMQTKAQTDLANVTANIDFIVKHEEAADGSWWYDLYRSGRVVQGGYTPTNTNSGVVNYPIEFADTNYSFLTAQTARTANFTDQGGSDYAPAISNYTTTSFRYTQRKENSCTCWEAKGYAATE